MTCIWRMPEATPGIQELLGGGLRLLIPDLSQILFQVIRHGQRLVQLERLLQLGLLIDLLVVFEILPVHDQQLARAL